MYSARLKAGSTEAPENWVVAQFLQLGRNEVFTYGCFFTGCGKCDLVVVLREAKNPSRIKTKDEEGFSARRSGLKMTVIRFFGRLFCAEANFGSSLAAPCGHKLFFASGSMPRKIIDSWYYERFVGR